MRNHPVVLGALGRDRALSAAPVLPCRVLCLALPTIVFGGWRGMFRFLFDEGY